MAKAQKNTDVVAAEKATETIPSPEAKRKPAHTVRVGDVSASVWSREHMVQGQMRTFHSVSFERSYKDRDGAYRYTKSFDPESLGALVTVIQKADEFLRGLED